MPSPTGAPVVVSCAANLPLGDVCPAIQIHCSPPHRLTKTLNRRPPIWLLHLGRVPFISSHHRICLPAGIWPDRALAQPPPRLMRPISGLTWHSRPGCNGARIFHSSQVNLAPTVNSTQGNMAAENVHVDPIERGTCTDMLN